MREKLEGTVMVGDHEVEREMLLRIAEHYVAVWRDARSQAEEHVAQYPRPEDTPPEQRGRLDALESSFRRMVTQDQYEASLRTVRSFGMSIDDCRWIQDTE